MGICHSTRAVEEGSAKVEVPTLLSVPQPVAKGKQAQLVRITANGESLDFDHLIVACDPASLAKEVMELTPAEALVFSPDHMKRFTYQTTLMKFPARRDVKGEDPLPYLRFRPLSVTEAQGQLLSWSSNTRLAFNGVPSDLDFELVTVYQFYDPAHDEGKAKSAEELGKILWDQMASNQPDWFPWKWESGEKIKGPYQATDYFRHFSLESMRSGQTDMWNYLDLQGNASTTYVHASTCFESVFNIYTYIEMLANMKKFPFVPATADSNSTRIGILGAGPSGLLAARKLQKFGYRSITILEKEPNSTTPYFLAGKTQTIPLAQFSQHAVKDHTQMSDVVSCEMGTCYLGPQYQLCGMIDELEDILVDNPMLKMDSYEPHGFEMEVVLDSQFEENGPVMRLWRLNHFQDIGLPYEPSKFPDWMGWPGPHRPNKGAYPFLKSFEEVYRDTKLSDDELYKKWGPMGNVFKSQEHLPAICTYIREYYMVFGGLGVDPKYVKQNVSKTSPLGSLPMPEVRPKHRELLELPIYDWLKQKNLLALDGTFQYYYAVQGYGSIDPDALSQIPAIYLMIWLPACAFTGQLLSLYTAGKKEWEGVEMLLGDESLKQDVNGFMEGLTEMAKLEPAKFEKLCLGTSRFSRGWGNLWVQQKQLLAAAGVKIDYNVKVSKIQRPGF